MRPLPVQYAHARRFIFAKGTKRGFDASAKPLLISIKICIEAIKSATSLDEFPLFTEIAVEYGSLLTKAILQAYVKGSDNSRKRRYRKNSIDLDDLLKFDWNLENAAAVAAFSRQAFIMAGVQTEELRNRLFEEARQVFASGGTYLDWADTFSMHGFAPENPYHLRTNYDTAANAAYAAGQWEQIEANKDLFPYLRYVTMDDDKVRAEHRALNGLIYHVDDPFWNTYLPPNDWNCRCGVEQLLESEVPANQQPRLAENPTDINPQFQNNPGITNQLNLYADALRFRPTTWSDAGLHAWLNYASVSLPKLLPTDHLSLSELLALYKDYLGNRIVLDVNNVPIVLPSVKADKFSTYALADLRGRFKYLPCLDNTLQHPHEVWLNLDTKRIYYLKRFDKNLGLIAELDKDNRLEYFNILLVKDNQIDSYRRGVLLYNQ